MPFVAAGYLLKVLLKGFAVSEYYCPKCGCEILDEENKPYDTEGGLKNALAKTAVFAR